MQITEILDDLYGSTRKETLAGKDREIDIIQSIPRPAAEFLYQLVRQMRPRFAIEVGMAWGFSSAAICAALRDNGGGASVIIDPYQMETWEGVAIAALERFGLATFAQVQIERSDLFLPKFWEGRKHRIDFAFVDGDHRIDAVFVDFYFLNKLLDVGGTIVFDDLQFNSVASVVRYALKNFHFEQLPCTETRFAVLRKLREDDRGWSDYGAF